ncbi:MAG: 50S ribosomal protein L15 [Cyanobacteria bacterium P01_E01_bin.34]
MRLNDIKPRKGATQRKRRICRGISAGQGATGGKGMRGQKSRSGGGTRPGFEGGQMPLYRRLPKLKHFKLINHNTFSIVNVEDLEQLKAGSEVTLQSLLDSGILTATNGPLKILGNGNLTKMLAVKASAITDSAKSKIEAAGGTVELV